MQPHSFGFIFFGPHNEVREGGGGQVGLGTHVDHQDASLRVVAGVLHRDLERHCRLADASLVRPHDIAVDVVFVAGHVVSINKQVAVTRLNSLGYVQQREAFSITQD
jgi:hypothetical protein